MSLYSIDTGSVASHASTSSGVNAGKADQGGFKDALQAASTKKSAAAEQLEAWLKMSPAQRMRAAILSQLGLTEEEIKNMSADEQKAVEAKIRQLMEVKMALQRERQGHSAAVI